MSIKRNLFGSFDNFRRSFQGNGAQSGKGGARKSGGKKRSAPKPFSPRLENLEERQLLSVVPPFADSLAGQTAPAAEISYAESAFPALDLSNALGEGSTLVVTTLDDAVDETDGVLSLREALAAAQDGDTVTFANSGTVVLSGTQLEITKSITIDATSLWDSQNNAPGVTVDANQASRVFSIASSIEVEFKGLTIANGRVDGHGGGVWVAEYAFPTFVNCTITNNTAYSTAYNVERDGGGLFFSRYSSGTFENCVISNNTVSSTGGSSDVYGGGVYFTGYSSGIGTFTNCVISGNVATANDVAWGGGVFLNYSSSSSQLSASFVNCTVAGNSAKFGGGVYNYGGYTTLTFQNSIVATNVGRRQVTGNYTTTDSLIGINPGFVCPPLFSDYTLSNADTLDLHLASYSTYLDYPEEGYLGAYEYSGQQTPMTCNVVTTLEDEFDLTNSAISLREALYLTPNGTPIVFASGLSGSIELNSTLAIFDSPEINGDDRITLDGQNECRVLEVWGNPRFVGLTISNGRVDGYGGGVWVAEYASPTFVDCTITNNTAYSTAYSTRRDGGGVYFCRYSSGTFENCVISNNTVSSTGGSSSAHGGGVSFADYDGCGTFTNCVISGNVVTGSNSALGGGVHIGYSSTANKLSVSFVNCTIAGNSAKEAGGVWKNDDRATLTFQNSIVATNVGRRQVTGNYTTTDSLIGINPGFVCPPLFSDYTLSNADTLDLHLASYSTYLDYPEEGYLGTYEYSGQQTPMTCNVVTTLQDEFDLTNSAVSLREALYLTPNDTPVVFAPGLSGSILLNSTLDVYDSPIINGDGRVTLDGQNERRVMNVWGSPRFVGLTIANGKVDGSGGGVWVAEYASPTFVDCTITNNTAYSTAYNVERDGGGLYFCRYSSGTFENCVISNNTVSSTGNYSDVYGGGVYFATYDGCGTFTNCVISGNVATATDIARGGGVYIGYSSNSTNLSVSLVNCTVAGNTAKEGGGVYKNTDSYGALTFQNSIVLLNTASSSGPEIKGSAAAYNTLSDFEGWSNASSEGVVNYVLNPDAPVFANPSANDYRLAPSSQAIDMGDNGFILSDRDLDGALRIYNGAVDLGAYEYQGFAGLQSQVLSGTVDFSWALLPNASAARISWSTVTSSTTLVYGDELESYQWDTTQFEDRPGALKLEQFDANGQVISEYEFRAIILNAGSLTVDTTDDSINEADSKTSLLEAIRYAEIYGISSPIHFASSIAGSVIAIRGTLDLQSARVDGENSGVTIKADTIRTGQSQTASLANVRLEAGSYSIDGPLNLTDVTLAFSENSEATLVATAALTSENLTVADISFFAGYYKTAAHISAMYVDYVRFDKHVVETYVEIPNKFTLNDVVRADCRTGDVAVNNTIQHGLGALGNDWETFRLVPGANQILCTWSEWSASAPEFRLKYRKVYQ